MLLHEPSKEQSKMEARGTIMRLASRLTWSRADGTIVDDITQSRFDRAREQLCLCFARKAWSLEEPSPSFQWFQCYIEAQAAEVWETLFAKVVRDVDGSIQATHIRAKIIVFEIVGVVATILAENTEATLEEVAQELEEKDEYLQSRNVAQLLHEGCDELYLQLVFHIAGWVTGLYSPRFDETLASFQISTDQGWSRRRTLLFVPTIRHSSAALDGRSRPIYELLERFGDLLPKPDLVLNESDLDRLDVESACISATYISFHHLTNTLKLEVRGTRVLGQHLEYDRRQNILYIFSLPSICSLALRDDGNSVLLKLLDGYRVNRTQADPSYQEADLRMYLIEVLLSYQLIFGTHKTSRKHAQALFSGAGDKAYFGKEADPLLKAICTQEDTSPQMSTLFREVSLKHMREYIPLEEFQFLGKRLLRLESISKSQNPSGWRRFWNDRRNPKEWFATQLTLAVMIIGGGTLLLQAMQLAFQIWQPPIGGNAS